MRKVFVPSVANVQQPPPETPGRLEQSLTNYPNRPTAKRGAGSLDRFVCA
jgi:hypothetical protein